MGKYSGWFLVELEEASAHLSPVHRRELQHEFADHLDVAIQARLELGEAPEAAELNAVKSLGSPRTIARSFVSTEQTRIDMVVVMAALAMASSLVATAAFIGHPMFKWCVALSFCSSGLLLFRSAGSTLVGRRTLLWTATLVLALLSVTLPLVRVSPARDDSVVYSAGSLVSEKAKIEDAFWGHLRHRPVLNGANFSRDERQLEEEDLLRRQFEDMTRMSLSERLSRGFTHNLPAAELLSALICLCLALPRRLRNSVASKRGLREVAR